MNLIVGHRYRTRAGAIVEVVKRQETGLTQYDSTGLKPLGPAHLIICHIVRCADGTQPNSECPPQYAVHDDGTYWSNRLSHLDLIGEAAAHHLRAAE